MTAQTYKENITGTSIGNDTLAGNGGAITSGATTLKVATTPSDAAGSAGLPATPPFDLACGTERMIATGVVAGTKTFTVTRGAYGTTAAAHNDGDIIELVQTTASFLAELALLAPLASPTFTGTTTAPEYSVSGLTGATGGLRFIGRWATVGPPASGTFAIGDVGLDSVGNAWFCTGAGSPGTWVTRSAIGCRVFNSQTQVLASGSTVIINGDSERFDTNTFHFTSAANLTGTLAKTAGSAAIVGSSTLFTSELSVNQVIAIPGTATEIGVVKTIPDNTHLTLWQTMANSASGQTVARRNDCIAIPANFGGLYLLFGNLTMSGVTAGYFQIAILVSGVTAQLDRRAVPAGTGNQVVATVSGPPYPLVPGDYIQMSTVQVGSTNPTSLVSSNFSPEFGLIFQGS